jgi:ATP-dependent RNA helicase DDX19/DBP5
MLTVVDESKLQCQAMCVCPTRELARQVAEVVEKLGKYTKIKVLQAIAGGERGKVTAQIVVGTPGSLQNKLKFRYVTYICMFDCLLIDSLINITSVTSLASSAFAIVTLLPPC